MNATHVIRVRQKVVRIATTDNPIILMPCRQTKLIFVDGLQWHVFRLDQYAMVTTIRCHIQTIGQGDVHDITKVVSNAVSESDLTAGAATVFVVGSTAAITTIEFEPGAVADFTRLFEQLAPRDGQYKHHERWGDDNGSSHVRAALLGPSLTLPFRDSQLMVGTWQQLVLVECDTQPREREFVVQLIGE
jgi:secondary thiamine-phosphate synthase enzyme